MTDQLTLFDAEPRPRETAPASLVERFIVPPFSVLDARSGYWQQRKRAWLALGIQSELGRGENSLGREAEAEAYRRGEGRRYQSDGYESSTGRDGQAFRNAGETPGRKPETASLRDGLTWPTSIHPYDATGEKRNAQAQTASLRGGLSLSTTTDPYRKPGEEAPANQSGTSIFDPVLCELVYRWFCPPGGAVLDPFAGGSVRGIAAAVLGRAYAGVELRAEQAAANEWQARAIAPEPLPRYVLGDAREVCDIAPGAYDLLFSCPPYGDLERYSDDQRDLSTLPYDEFLAAYQRIVAASLTLLRPDRFACFVVGDIRDKRGAYRGFVCDTIAAFEAAGARLYNEAILVTAVGSLPIRVGKQFESSRKLGKTHQNVLIFVKGDARKATAACGPVELATFDPFGVTQ